MIIKKWKQITVSRITTTSTIVLFMVSFLFIFVSEADEKKIRDQEYVQKDLNKPWLPENKALMSDGAVRTLDNDMYVDKVTGNILRRSTKEQQVFEANAHRIWMDNQKRKKIEQELMKMASDFKSGAINQEQYKELLTEYENKKRMGKYKEALSLKTIKALKKLREDYIMKLLARLNHTKFLDTLKALNVKSPDPFFDCLCRNAGYGSPGTRQFYHPDTLGKFDERYSCQHPGEPCVVAGNGCLRHPFPKNINLMTRCATTHKIDDGKSIVDFINEKLREHKNYEAKLPTVSPLTKERCELAISLLVITKVTFDHAGWMALCVGEAIGEDIIRYGNWYGPGYWGGFEHPTRAGPKAPVDSLDAVAQRHDFGYELANRYGKIYGYAVELRLRGIADKIAVREASALPDDPTKWDHPPAKVDKAKRYRVRMISMFVTESKFYKKSSKVVKGVDVLTSPFVTYHDKVDYTNIPGASESEVFPLFEKQVSSLINGWGKNEAGKSQEFWIEEREKKAKALQKEDNRKTKALNRVPFHTTPVK